MAKLIVFLLVLILTGAIFVNYKMDHRVDSKKEIEAIKKNKEETPVSAWGDTIDPVTLIEKKEARKPNTKVKKQFTDKVPQEVEPLSPPPLEDKVLPEPPQEVIEEPAPSLPNRNPLKPSKRTEADTVTVAQYQEAPLPHDLGPLQDPNTDPSEVLDGGPQEQEEIPQDVPQEEAPAPEVDNSGPPMPEGLNPGQAKNWQALQRHNQAQEPPVQESQGYQEDPNAQQELQTGEVEQSGPEPQPNGSPAYAPPPPVQYGQYPCSYPDCPNSNPDVANYLDKRYRWEGGNGWSGQVVPGRGIEIRAPFFHVVVNPWRRHDRIERRQQRRYERKQRKQWRRYG